jgi:hypothetical protein
MHYAAVLSCLGLATAQVQYCIGHGGLADTVLHCIELYRTACIYCIVLYFTELHCAVAVLMFFRECSCSCHGQVCWLPQLLWCHCKQPTGIQLGLCVSQICLTQPLFPLGL